MTRSMAMESSSGPMAECTKANGSKENSTARASTSHLTALKSMENGKMDRGLSGFNDDIKCLNSPN